MREARDWDVLNIRVAGADGTVRWVLHQIVEVTALVRGEEAAAQAERRPEGIIERMGDARCVVDRELRIAAVNAAAERVLGRPREMLLGRSHWEVRRPSMRQSASRS